LISPVDTDEGALRSLLQGALRIAVVGLSPKPPVFPREESILGHDHEPRA